MKRLLIALGLILLGLFSASATNHYKFPAKSTRNEVMVKVVFLPDLATVDAVCSFFVGQIPEGRILGCTAMGEFPVMYVVEPQDFKDYQRLLILGHEFWHALGATHPEE